MLLIFLFFLKNVVLAQNSYLKIVSKSTIENKIIDSIGYNTKFTNSKAVFDEFKLVSTKLLKLGYINSELISNNKENDSTFLFEIKLKKRTDYLHIYIGKNSSLKTLSKAFQKKDTIAIKISETESYLNVILNEFEIKGYSLAKLKLDNFLSKNNLLFAELILDQGNYRSLNNIVIKGYDNFPESHKKEILRIFKNKTFNQDNLGKVQNAFEKFRFVNQIKYPEILFTRDTTKIYVYLEKAKANKFDGFLGFANNKKNNLELNGYLDLLFVNIMNAGENLSIYWKSDIGNQKTFNLSLELPYLFKSPLGIKANLNIYKQDTIFQNAKTSIEVGYYFKYNSRLYLGYQSVESSDIQNTNNSTLKDFNNYFVTANFEYVNLDKSVFLFPEKTKLSSKFGYGSRYSNSNNYQQFFANIDISHSLFLNDRNSIYLKSRNYYLQSDQYIINELYRFGGINSIRGFNENSLQGNFFSSLISEYRYLVSPEIYIHSIIDYGYYSDATSSKKDNLFGYGFGFGLLTKNGLLNMVYANGNSRNENIQLSNSIVHLSLKLDLF
ncbi:MAG: hypothetical protein EBR38_02990 [Flavobacteriaceae bacterium]|nr:hypothetical protein [Flavobacteriaceae bacterium]